MNTKLEQAISRRHDALQAFSLNRSIFAYVVWRLRKEGKRVEAEALEFAVGGSKNDPPQGVTMGRIKTGTAAVQTANLIGQRLLGVEDWTTFYRHYERDAYEMRRETVKAL